MENQGKLIIITGSTGSGKDTIVAELRKINPSWKQIVTSTTRSMRPNEAQGVEYNFLDRETFKKMENNGDFIETVEYAGNHYGTPKTAFNPLFAGVTLIWRIEASMSAKVNELINTSFDLETAKNLIKNIKVFYIDLPDKETIYKRLRTRGMSGEEIERRINQDEKDRAEYQFEHIIINSDGYLNESVQKIVDLIKS